MDPIQASYNGFVMNGSTYTPIIGISVDHPEERTVLSLKRRDSDVDCTHSVLQSRVPNAPRSQPISFLSEED